jgi:hypothetical protein
VTLYNNNDTSLLGTIPNGINNNGVDTPEFSGGTLGVNHDPSKGLAFDTAKFSLPTLGTQGNTTRRFFYGPGTENFDTAVMKQLRVGANGLLEMRAESFNTLNHSQFFGAAAVDGNISSQNFGVIENAASPRLVQLGAKYTF